MALVFAVLGVLRKRSSRNRRHMYGVMALNDSCRNRRPVWFLPARVAPRLRTASPAEADGSFPREGPVPSVDNRSEGYERRCGFVDGEVEVEMTTLFIAAVVVGALSGLAQQQQSRKAVVVRRSSN
jgi:hypothetical protein